MANERSTDLILRAQVDQALQPLAQVTTKVKELVAALAQQQVAAANGIGSTKDYARSLQDLIDAAGQLLLKREALDAFSRKQASVDKQQTVVDTRQQKRDDFAASLPDVTERTDKQTNALTRLDNSLAGSVTRLNTLTATFQKSADQLVHMGVLTDQLDAKVQRLALDRAHAEISAAQLQAAQGISEGKAGADPLQKALLDAGVQNQVANQRARDATKFIADQEREKQAVLDAATAIREKGRIAQEAADKQSPLNARRFDVEEAFRVADAEKALANRRAKDASEFQAEQRALAAEVSSVWAAEDAAAVKARESFDAFRATVQKAQGQVASLHADAASRAGALGVPVPSPAPTLAARVQAGLVPPPSPGTTPADLAGLQSAVFKVHSTLYSAGAGVDEYTQGLKRLDVASRELGRQSQIVDSFARQKAAADAARKAFDDVVAEIARLEASAKTITNPDQLSEVTSRTTALRRSVDPLANRAQQEREALAAEEAALNKIGVTVGTLDDALIRYTNLAVTTSRLRREALALEKTALDAQVDARVRAASSLTAPVAGTSAPSARSAVSAVAGATERGVAPIVDTAAAVDKLDASVGKAQMTTQTFNKTMDQVYAVQRQIASDASLIDQFTRQKTATDAARASFTAAQAEVVRLGAAVKAGSADVSELARAERTLETSRGNLQGQVTQQAQVDAALLVRRISTANLTAETDKLIASATRLATVQSRATQGNPGLFGLSSYQLQNLSFQANDVITQLSLGQGVLRTFESQAGQIFQIFETSISAMRTMLLIGAPVATAIGLIVLSLERVYSAEGALRSFNAALAGTVDATGRSSAVLLGLQRQAERLGLSFAEAGTAVKTFLGQNLSSERIEQFTTAVVNMTRAFGITTDEATKKLSIIPTGSIDDLEKLLQEMKLLTPELARYLEAQRDGGTIDAARAATIDAVSEAMKRAKKDGIGPYSDGIVELKNSWHDFLDALGSQEVADKNKGFFKALIDGARGTVDVLSALTKGLTGQGRGGSTDNPALRNAQHDVDTLSDKFRTAFDKYNTLRDELTKQGIETNPLLDRLGRQVDELEKKLISAADKFKLLQLAGQSPEGGPTTGTNAINALAGSAASAALEHRGQTLQAVAPFIGQSIEPIINAWCAAFANAALRAAGIQGTGTNVATDFEKWGVGIANAAEVRAGDILVQSKGHPAGEPGGHVGIATGNFKTGSDGVLLVEMVSGNYGSKVATSFEDPRQLGIRRAGTTQVGSNFPTQTGVMTGNAVPGLTQSANQLEQTRLQRMIDQQLSQEAMGNSALRIARDKAEADAKRREVQAQMDKDRNGLEEDDQSKALRAKLDTDFRSRQKSVRDKEDAQVKQEADAAKRALDDRIANADPTNAAAKRQAALNATQASLDQIAALVAKGVTTIGGMPIEQFRNQVLKLRDQAVDIATAEADKAIVDAAVKERDDRVSKIAADLKAGTITLQQAFDQTAEVVRLSGTRVRAAIAVSNADLRAQPQTARAQERLAANAKIDPNDAKAFETLDAESLTKIGDLISARNDKVKTLNDLVANGHRTQREADAEQIKAYAEAKPVINGLIDSLQKQIDLQRSLGEISPEVYAKMKAAIEKTKASNDDLTASQRKFANEVDQSIVSHALQGFDTLAQAVGNVAAGVGNIGDVAKAVGVAFSQFAAGVLKDIASIIIKQEILNALQSSGAGGGIAKLFNAGAGAAAGAGSAAAESGTFIDTVSTLSAAAHEGGIIGATTMSRSVNPDIFANARRMHTGGVVGLGPQEVPLVGKVGEEMLTANDPRHRNNYTGKPEVTSAPQSIRQVLVMNERDLAGALAGSHGEKTVITHIKNNAGAIRSILGNG